MHSAVPQKPFLTVVSSSSTLLSFFTDSGIRDHIISKSMCVCGRSDVLADDLLPNKTLRDTINRILEAGNDSTENVGSVGHIPGPSLF
jgi:E3 ubiquitin-protein ligase RBBP6